MIRQTWVFAVERAQEQRARRSPRWSVPAPTRPRTSRSRSVSDARAGWRPAPRWAAGEPFEQPPGHAGREQRVTGGDHPDRAHQLDRLGVLDQESARAGADRLGRRTRRARRSSRSRCATPRGRGPRRSRRVAHSPSTSGMRMSMSTTSGRARAQRTASAPCRPRRRPRCRPRLEQRAEPAADQLLVVGDRDPDHPVAPFVARGMRAVTRNRRRRPRPPRACRRATRPARACRAVRRPPASCLGATRARPVVADRQHVAAAYSSTSRSVAVVAAACLSTFVSDSCAIRYRASWIAAEAWTPARCSV